MRLHGAAQHGSRDMIQKSLDEGDDPNDLDGTGWTALSYAARNGDHETVELLLQANGIDPNAQNKDGTTPLSLAAGLGHDDVLRVLLQTDGIDLNTQDKDGTSPLSKAAANGRDKIVKLLLQWCGIGINLNAQDKHGMTPLSNAAAKGHDQVIKLLLRENDIDLNARDKYGMTALSHAAKNGHDKVVERLVQEYKIRLHTQDKDDMTPLSYAAANGHEKIVKLLIQADGIDFDAEDDDIKLLLFLAAKADSAPVVRMLADSTDYGDRTALSWAAEHGHAKVVEMLLEMEYMDPSSKDDGGKTPLSRALENRHRAVVELLASVDTTTLHELVRDGERAQVLRLLDIKNVINQKDSRRQTPLHMAILYNQSRLVEDLITLGADVNSERSDGITPLRLAIQRKDVYSIELLLQNGAQARGVMIEEWLDAHGRNAPEVTVELSEDPRKTKCLQFKDREPIDVMENLGPSRLLLSVYPCPNSEAEAVAQSLFVNCPGTLKHVKSASADISSFRMLYDEIKTKENTVICLAARYPAGQGLLSGKHFTTSWNMCAIAWTIIAPTKPQDGLNWKSRVHISMLPYGWIPNDGADFFQKFLLYLKEKWLGLCDLAEKHLSSQRLRQLQEKGDDPELIQDLAEDAKEWDRLRRILQLEVSTAREFATQHFRQYDVESLIEVREAIDLFSRELSDRLRQLDQTVKDILQFEFAWVSINEAHRSTSIATSMKRLSWITFVFLPAMFTSSLFGMNVDVLATNPDWRWYVLFVSVILSITIFGWLLFKYGQIEGWIEQNMGKRLERLGKLRKNAQFSPE